MYYLFLLGDDGWELMGEFHRKEMMEYYRKQWSERGWTLEYTAW